MGGTGPLTWPSFLPVSPQGPAGPKGDLGSKGQRGLPGPKVRGSGAICPGTTPSMTLGGGHVSRGQEHGTDSDSLWPMEASQRCPYLRAQEGRPPVTTL